MKKEGYIPACIEQPDIDTTDCQAFKINFQRAILLSLLQSQKLNQAQFEVCMDKIVQKYAAHSPL